MSAQEKHIDEKIKERALKKGELADLGDEIALSARPTVVAFIDLADSTAMKEDRAPEEWLGSVYEFLIRVSDLVKAAGGTVVKRIGDEVMATFTKVEQSEAFINALIEDTPLRAHRYKIALDFGKAFHFQFIEGREDDPYGTVVDRCARISKLATPDTIICTGDYHDQLPPKGTSRYTGMGKFPLKGLKDHCTVYMCSFNSTDTKKYLEPLLYSLNQNQSRFDGFKQIGRKFTADDLRVPPEGTARPFLARELINLPKCPFSFSQFMDERSRAERQDDFDIQFLGYVVDWEMVFESYRIDDDAIAIRAELSAGSHRTATLMLTKSHLEVAKLFAKGQRLRIRGVLQYMYISPHINYVELYLADKP